MESITDSSGTTYMLGAEEFLRKVNNEQVAASLDGTRIMVVDMGDDGATMAYPVKMREAQRVYEILVNARHAMRKATNYLDFAAALGLVINATFGLEIIETVTKGEKHARAERERREAITERDREAFCTPA